MEFNVFFETVKCCLEEKLGGEYQIFGNRVRKNNGVFRKGLTIRYRDRQVCPTIYLEPYFLEFKQGKEFEDIIGDILEKYRQAQQCGFWQLDLSFSYAKEKIFYRLINKEQNSGLFEECPMVPFLDLAVMFYLSVDGAPEGEQAAVRITRDMMKYWQVEEETLMELAQENTRKLLPPVILTMQEMIGRLILQSEQEHSCLPDEWDGEELEGLSLYILTNEQNINGAAVILYPGVVREFAEKLEADLYLLPSSVHEFLLLPKIREYETGELEAMVRSVNDTQLPQEDFLSDYVYYYDRKEGKIERI